MRKLLTLLFAALLTLGLVGCKTTPKVEEDTTPPIVDKEEPKEENKDKEEPVEEEPVEDTEEPKEEDKDKEILHTFKFKNTNEVVEVTVDVSNLDEIEIVATTEYVSGETPQRTNVFVEKYKVDGVDKDFEGLGNISKWNDGKTLEHDIFTFFDYQVRVGLYGVGVRAHNTLTDYTPTGKIIVNTKGVNTLTLYLLTSARAGVEFTTVTIK